MNIFSMNMINTNGIVYWLYEVACMAVGRLHFFSRTQILNQLENNHVD